MMHRRLALSVLCGLAACAEPPPPRVPEPQAEPAPSAPASVASPAPSAPPRPQSSADAAPPPLSSPNAPAPPKPDAGQPEASDGDPRTAGIRRIGVAAQECHSRHAPGIKGRLTLRIAPDQSGAVKSASIVRAQSSKELALPALETCVLDAVKKERLSPARDEDDELELPLTFEPTH